MLPSVIGGPGGRFAFVIANCWILRIGTLRRLMPGGLHALTLSKGKPEERYHQQADPNSEPLVPSHKLFL